MSEPVRVSTFSASSILLAALHRGFLADAGLAVTVEMTSGSRQQLADLRSRRHAIAHTNADNIMRWRADNPDLFIFLVTDTGIAQKLVVAPHVTGWADLRGATVAVDAPDSGYAFVLYELLRRRGVEPGSYDVRAAGSSGLRLAALQAGEASAALLGFAQQARAADSGLRFLAAARDEFAGLPGMTAATTRTWAAQHPQELLDYAVAMLAAAAWATRPDNHDDVLALTAGHGGLTPEQARRTLEDETSGRTGLITSVAAAQQSLALTSALRSQYTGVQPSGYFDPQVLGSAFEQQLARP